MNNKKCGISMNYDSIYIGVNLYACLTTSGFNS